MAVWAGSWRVGVVSPGKGMVRVKSKLVKRTQHIPRLRGWSTKWLGRERWENEAQDAPKIRKRTLENRANGCVSWGGGLLYKANSTQNDTKTRTNHQDPPRERHVIQFGLSGKDTDDAKTTGRRRAVKDLVSQNKASELYSKEIENWSILKKRSDNRTDFKKNYSGNTLTASRLIRYKIQCPSYV